MSKPSSANSSDTTPSLLTSHARYAAGAVKETIGGITGSEDWKATGQSDKDEAVKEMRSAREASGDEPGVGGPKVGKVEESLGNAVGCEGMVSDGQKKQHDE